MATLSTNVPDAAAPNFIVKALVPICGAVQSARGVILCIIPCRGARTVWVNSWLMVLEEFIWTDRPHLQVLAPTLPFFYHSSDDDMLMQVARYLGATKKAMSALKDYYEFELPHITAQRPNVAFPHLSEYHSLDDATIHRFKYLSHLDKDRRIFRGAVNNDKISIKFVRRYSKEAHLKCSSLGFAPALRGFEPIPCGWYIVVMTFINDEYQDLATSPAKASFESEVRAKVDSLHEAGFVQGDIRSANIMVKKDGSPGIMLLGQVCLVK